MVLPLLERMADDKAAAFAYLTPKSRQTTTSAVHPLTFLRGTETPAAFEGRMPMRALEPGEQYRFHVDMRKCIGCKCCVVACNEQNGNPPAINWRRVGELEGGWYPNATRTYLSMGCNHCLEPTCLSGCPVDAYTKEPVSGIVRHSADACIGCQYCTWNCSYGVPQFNPERGVVGKCDMCHGRLDLGQTPACVNACPEGALQIEIVNVSDWRAKVDAAVAATGMPASDESLSTTRVTLPESLPPNTAPRDITHVVPAEPHWPLVVMTVLTQLAVGGFGTIWILQLLGASTGLGLAAIASLTVASMALGASTLHLGRPVHAYRALRMWKRSWLSREVLLFSAFSGVAALYAGMLWFRIPGGAFVGGLTVLLGLAGVTASGCIYRVPSRPAWNTKYTVVQFNLTAAVLGPLFAAAVGVADRRWLAAFVAVVAGVQLILLAARFLHFTASDNLELRGTARLLSTVLASRLMLRGALLAAAALVLPVVSARATDPSELSGTLLMAGALVFALASELLGRYLFFVSVVPKHMAAPYVAIASEAA